MKWMGGLIAHPGKPPGEDQTMSNFSRRDMLQSATMAATVGVIAARSAFVSSPSLAQPKPGAPADGVKALVYDVFGTCVDWRNGVARDAERILRPLGYKLDWIGFADAWRALYQPTMEEVR
jgi:hypothetical protein